MIDYFAGVMLWTDNLDSMLTFYRDRIGLPVHSIHADFVAFELGKVRFSIGLHSEVHGMARDPYRVMIHLGVLDIHKTYDQLLAAAVEFIRAPEQEEWGGWVATFRDPDGNLVQLLQVPA